jgi:AraC-like DNA-binding protein
MIWSFLFVIGIAQGIFLLSVILLRSNQNESAKGFITALIVLIIITNADFFLLTSGFSRTVPKLFGISFGMMLAFGPLLYLYSKSVTEINFSWKFQYSLHFLPYFLKVVFQFQLYTIPHEHKQIFIDMFLSGTLPLRPVDAIVFCFESFHLLLYLVISARQVKPAKRTFGNVSYIISITSRVKWLNLLFWCFALYLVVIIVLVIFTIFKWKYIPESNYLYTLLTSCILFIISYKYVWDPELISPHFNKKYQFTKKVESNERTTLLEQLNLLIEQEKIYLQPDLKLSTIAEKMGIPSHQLSRIINEEFQKTFSEFINEQRVREFIKRVNDPSFQNYSLYGIALDVGFSSKSSFNNIFKKATGKTPSEFKKS